MEKNQKILEINLELIKKILGKILKYYKRKTQKEPKEKENKTGDNLKCSLNLFFIK